jgi:hypothetical protein
VILKENFTVSTVIRTGKIRTGKIRTGKIRTGKIRTELTQLS